MSPVSLSEKVTRFLNNDRVIGKSMCDKLMQLVADQKGCIAGSSVMQAINDIQTTNMAWDESDIDIWLPNTGLIGSFIDILQSNNYSISKMDPGSKKTYARLTKYVQTIYSFARHDKKTIQVMVCKVKRVSLVVNTFDITAAKIMYRQNSQGDRKIGLIRTDNNRALEECLSRKLTISEYASENQTLAEWIRTTSRLAKYKTRGFTMDPDELNRIVKYVGKQSAVDSGYEAIQEFVMEKIARNLLSFLKGGQKIFVREETRGDESFPVLVIKK